MTHASAPFENRGKLGIVDGFIRLSVGIEDTLMTSKARSQQRASLLDELRARVACLVGLPMLAPARAGSMLTLQLGTLRAVPSALGRPTRMLGEYALHVQCPWRITHAGSKNIVDSNDMFVPAGDPDVEPDDWE